MITDSALALFVALCNSVYVKITTTHLSCIENDNYHYSIKDMNADLSHKI